MHEGAAGAWAPAQCTALGWVTAAGVPDQAGASGLLRQPDATGMLPAQLAKDKGHIFLAHYLEEYSSRHDGTKKRAPLLACAPEALLARACLHVAEASS